jgi:hypothetical protein
MNTSNHLLNFINTLIYAIMASTLAVVILIMMFIEPLQQYMIFFVVVEIGLIVLIMYALTTMVNYESEKSKAIANYATQTPETIRSCPDLFKAEGSGSNLKCIGRNGEFGEFEDKPGTYRFGNTNGIEITPSSLAGSNNKTRCDNVFRNDPIQYAWTDLRSKCDVISGNNA